MVATSAEEAAGITLKMRVAGMDGSACGIKVENALKRLPGVANISLNYATELLASP